MKKAAIMLCVVVCFAVLSGRAGATVLSFGISTEKTKIGNASGNATYGGGFHNIAVSGQNVYVAFISPTASADEVHVGVSSDGGVTWGKDLIVAQGAIDTNGAAIAVTSDGNGGDYLHVVWAMNWPNGDVYYRRGYRSGGNTTWSAPVQISSAFLSYPYTRVVAAYGNEVHIAYTSSDGSIIYITSDNNGETFAAPVPLTTASSGCDVGIAVDATGNVLISWTNSLTGLNVIEKTGGNWGPIENLATDVTGSNGPSIAFVGATPYILVPKGSGMALFTKIGAAWILKPFISQPTWGECSLVADSAGQLSIVYGINTGTYVMRSRDAGNNWSGPFFAMSGNWDPNAALDANGKLIVVNQNGAVYATREK